MFFPSLNIKYKVMSNTFYNLKVKEVISETDQSKSIEFEIPAESQEAFSFKAGQYLTIKATINDNEVRRSYSLSSAPYEERLRVCVKRVPGGLMSNYLCDTIKTGDTLSVMAPDGRFVYEVEPEQEAHYYLFAAGSGITPILAIAKEILEKESLSTVFLMYGNSTMSSVIYKEELDQMEQKHQGQFFIKYVYSKEKQKRGLLKSLFKRSSVELPYFPGRVDKETIKKFLSLYPVLQKNKTYAYICGPGKMNETVKEILVKQGLVQDQVHFESFGTVGAEKKVNGGSKSKVYVELDGKHIELEIDRSVKVLDALVDAGYDPPHSCGSGACSSCMAQLAEGKVTMDVSHALDDDDIADGYILSCQSRVDSEVVRIVYE